MTEIELIMRAISQHGGSRLGRLMLIRKIAEQVRSDWQFMHRVFGDD